MTDTNFIKLLGKANIPEPLEIDKAYAVVAQVEVTDVKRSTNHNGEYDVTFVAKPFDIEIVKQTGERFKAKDPRRNSQKIRLALWKYYFDEGMTEDFDEVYNEATAVICSMVPTVLREVKRRLE